jgi:hypothetical protein
VSALFLELNARCPPLGLHFLTGRASFQMSGGGCELDLDARLIRPIDSAGRCTPGSPKPGFQPQPRAPPVRIGIDLGGTKIEIIALDDVGVELYRERVSTPRGSYEGTIEALVSLVAAAERARAGTARWGSGCPVRSRRQAAW